MTGGGGLAWRGVAWPGLARACTAWTAWAAWIGTRKRRRVAWVVSRGCCRRQLPGEPPAARGTAAGGSTNRATQPRPPSKQGAGVGEGRMRSSCKLQPAPACDLYHDHWAATSCSLLQLEALPGPHRADVRLSLRARASTLRRVPLRQPTGNRCVLPLLLPIPLLTLRAALCVLHRHTPCVPCPACCACCAPPPI